jgi:hypothetical protein
MNNAQCHMERFSPKNLNEEGGKNSVGLKSQIGSRFWKTWMMMGY